MPYPAKMKKPHVLMVPYPAQGHVMPLMEFSQVLINHGIKITFVNTEFVHQRIMGSLRTKPKDLDARIRFVSVPDGMGPEGNRAHIGQTLESICQFMSGELKRLIHKINTSDDDDIITCIVSDMFVGFPIDVAAEMGIKAAGISPLPALSLLTIFKIPMMIDQGIIDENGTPLKREMIQFSPETPTLNPSQFLWACVEDMTTQKILIEYFKRSLKTYEKAEWLFCNSTYDVETGALESLPNVYPIGPLSAYEGVETWAANFWPQDDSCLKWLDQQGEGSVVYVAFGSLAVLSETQFRELAMGLELSNKRFLWVARPDIIEGGSDAFPKGFQDRVSSRSRIVSWAPQRAVLGHPSVGCFLSHCGWNSTIQGISNGVPFLSWPFFGDQLPNARYICETWKVGLKFEKDENGIVSREEVKNKVEEVLGDKKLRQRALELKEKTQNSVKEGGSSDEILKKFIQWVKSK